MTWEIGPQTKVIGDAPQRHGLGICVAVTAQTHYLIRLKPYTTVFSAAQEKGGVREANAP
jgi:hypothetical protein